MKRETILQKKKRAAKILGALKKQYPDADIALNYKTDPQLLVAVVLSAQMRDEQVNKTTGGLFRKYKTINDFALADPKEFEQEIKSVNFFKNKAKNIINACNAIQRNYKGKIPDSIDDLVKLPGIGRKTANVLLWHIYKKSEGIVVDTHVRRVSNNLRLTDEKDPVRIEEDLMEIFPKKEWGMIGHYFQFYGRKVMRAKGQPIDEDCLKGLY